MKKWDIPLTLHVEADTQEEAEMIVSAILVEFDGYSFTFAEGSKHYPRVIRS